MTAILLILNILRDSKKGNDHDVWALIRTVKDCLIEALVWFLFGSWMGAVFYVSMRICFFDYGLNIARGQHWSYLSDGNPWDRSLKKVNPYLLLAIRVKLLILTIWII